mmetsp:Transcript_32402/g.63314  ORF Transcript_32402/g.63314 Transcript_32402/m.63314 type:complete len:216 (+) Transcript_32402:126-773(+)
MPETPDAQGAAEASGAAADHSTTSPVLEDEGDKGGKREIGGDAVWTLSTAKPGNGVEQLRDDSTDTYWQSDGPQPHLVNIQFHNKVSIKEVAIYCNYRHDESYTPSKISIRAGTHFHDLQEIQEVSLDEPNGWLRIPLRRADSGYQENETATNDQNHLRAFMIQIAILANHENGRDSHIRQIKIFGPRSDIAGCLAGDAGMGFSTQDFCLYSMVR